MKKSIATLIFLVIVTLGYGQQSKTVTATIQTEIFCNHCLECESCDLNIFTHLKKQVKGVKSMKIDVVNNTITVKYNRDKTTLEAIEKAISMAGFKANNLSASPEAYEKLDDCCKKKAN